MKNFVLILAFGIDEVFAETRFLLLRQLALTPERAPDYEFVIYTDRPQAFAMFEATTLRIRVVACDTARFAQWRGRIDFVFRIKIEFLRDFCANSVGNVLYLDSDVYPRCDLAPMFDAIGSGAIFMYASEGRLKDCPWYADFQRFFARASVSVNGVEQRIAPTALMWNAGAIGFPTNMRFVLDRVLEMTDAVYPQLHAPATEQFAFSYLLGQQAEIRDARAYVHHYYGLAQLGFADVITRFFDRCADRTLNELVAASERILPERIEPAVPIGFGNRPHHQVYMRYPFVWRAIDGLKRFANRRATSVTRFYKLVDSL